MPQGAAFLCECFVEVIFAEKLAFLVGVYYNNFCHADMAQLVEQLIRNWKVK